LSDGQGRTIDFTNSIIIATSNIGALYIQEEIFKGTPIEQIKNVLINNHLNKYMRPELINRFDGIVVFEPLSRDNVMRIAFLLLENIGKMLALKGINMRIEDEGLKVFAEEGYDPKFGARPLRRLLQDKIENQIANKILNGELKRRDTVVINSAGNVQVEKASLL
jgi:ATP-dependent Clp protease ATP-binding subunit ClpB